MDVYVLFVYLPYLFGLSKPGTFFFCRKKIIIIKNIDIWMLFVCLLFKVNLTDDVYNQEKKTTEFHCFWLFSIYRYRLLLLFFLTVGKRKKIEFFFRQNLKF